jgi:hypothetical protein
VHIVVVCIRWMQDAFLYYTDALCIPSLLAWHDQVSSVWVESMKEYQSPMPGGSAWRPCLFALGNHNFKHLIALISRTRGSSVKISPTDWPGEVELVLNVTIPC